MNQGAGKLRLLFCSLSLLVFENVHIKYFYCIRDISVKMDTVHHTIRYSQ